MKKRQKFLVTILSSLILVGCGNSNSNQNSFVSELFGRFENSDNITAILTNDDEKINQDNYLYTSDYYPLNTIVNEEVNYIYNQTLRLIRDGTYEYKATIELRKVAQTGNTNLGRLEVESQGTFTFEQITDVNYNVTLSDPISGSEKFYGASISGTNNIYGFTMSSSPSYVFDVETVLNDNLDYQFDRFLKGKTIEIEKGEERILIHDLFYSDLLNDFGTYYNYQTINDEDSNTDDEEIPNDDEEEASVNETLLPLISNERLQIELAYIDNLNLKLTVDSDDYLVNNQTLDYHKQGDKYVSYYQFDYQNLDDFFTINNETENIQFKVYDYLKSYAEYQDIYHHGLASFSASILNLYSLIEEDKLYDEDVLSSSLDNIYHSDFGQRDNLTLSESGVEGFEFLSVPSESLNGSNVELIYPFNFPKDNYLNISSIAKIGNRTLNSEIVIDENDNYYAKVEVSNPLDFTENIDLRIYDGDNAISPIASYSVMRGNAKMSLDENNIQEANVIYTLAKSSYEAKYQNQINYLYLPKINNGDNYLKFTISQFTYHYQLNDDSLSVSNHPSLYIDGEIIDNQRIYDNENFNSYFENNTFYITLKGGTIDGIEMVNNVSFDKVVITVASPTVIEKVLISPFGVGLKNASIAVSSDLEIIGKELSINGNIYAANIDINNNLNLNLGANLEGAISCQNLTLNHSKVNISNLDSKYNTGIISLGNIVVDKESEININNVKEGISLIGDGNQKLEVNGNLYINSKEVGITGLAPTLDNQNVNHQLYFNDGNIVIEANTGIKYGNVTVDKSNLTIIANNGYTIEGEDASRKVTFKTISNDYNIGKVTLINNTYNPYWDVNYVLKVGEIYLNGGNVKIFGMCKDGLIHTYQGTNIYLGNTTLEIENGQDLVSSYGRGIKGDQGDEMITISNEAIVIFKNCDAPISCRGKTAAAENYCKLINYGKIILDTYKLGFDQWELDSWSNNLIVENHGSIKTTNKM